MRYVASLIYSHVTYGNGHVTYGNGHVTYGNGHVIYSLTFSFDIDSNIFSVCTGLILL